MFLEHNFAKYLSLNTIIYSDLPIFIYDSMFFSMERRKFILFSLLFIKFLVYDVNEDESKCVLKLPTQKVK